MDFDVLVDGKGWKVILKLKYVKLRNGVSPLLIHLISNPVN
jgi:hypothetical protein